MKKEAKVLQRCAFVTGLWVLWLEHNASLFRDCYLPQFVLWIG